MGAVVSAVAGAALATAGVLLIETPFGTPLILAGVGLAASGVSAALTAQEPIAASLSARKTNITQSDAPWRLIYGKTRVGGVIRYAGTSGSDHKYLNLIIVLACHEVKSIGAMWRNNEQVTDENGVPLAKWGSDRFLVVKRLGTQDQAAVSELIAEAPGDWTVDHRLRGLAYVYVRIKWSATHLPDGKGELSFDVEGNNQVYDPRTGLRGYTQNTALCTADYITSSKYGIGASYDDIDSDDLVSSANACDENVVVLGSPTVTQKRFVCNGSIDLNVRHADVLAALVASMAGKVIPSGASWRVLAGIWREPTLTIGMDDLRGGISIEAKRESSAIFNTLTGTFVGEETNYEPTDYSPVAAKEFLDADGGVEIDGNQDFIFTDDHTTCTRIAKILLSQNRRQISVDWPGTLSCYRLRPGDTVSVTLDRYGWSAKTFEVGAMSLLVEADEAGAPRLAVDVTLSESDEDVYAWSTEDETPPPAALTTNLADPSVVTSPAACNVATGADYAFTRADGSWISRLYVYWPAPNDAFVTDGGTIQVAYRKTSDTGWTPGVTVSGDQLFAYLDGVQDGESYRARVRSVNLTGGFGPWVESTDIVIQGKVSSALDVDAESFRITRLADGTRSFSWTLSNPSRDLVGYAIRYSVGINEDDWSEMTPLNKGLLTASPWETNQLAAGTYVFAIKAYDRSGNESANARVIEATIGDPRLANVLISRDEGNLGWTGTLTDCFVDPEGFLEAKSSQTWADLADDWLDLSSTWGTLETSDTPITYETQVIDLGFNASFTPLVDVDCRGTATIQMRTSADAFGSPLPDYAALGKTTARYLQIKVSVADDSPLIRSMTINLDAELKSDYYNDLDTSGATGTPAGFEHVGTGHFKVETHGKIAAISAATIEAIQGTTGGITWTVSDKATTITGGTNPAAEFRLFDASGDPVDATVDIELRGLAA